MDYRHVDKDPIIDLVRTIAQEERGDDLRGEVLEKLAHDSGVSVGTLRHWFFGETRRPQNLTVRMVLQALNCRVKIYRHDGTEVRGPRPNVKAQTRKPEGRAAQAAATAG